MPLTKRQVDALQYDPAGPARQILYDDGEIPGFGVRVYPSGKKSFVVWYRTPTGRARLLTLGRYGPFTLDAGRRLARSELLRIRTGSDPVAERRTERQGDTLRAFAKEYIRRHAKPHKKEWRRDQRELDRYILPVFGSRKLSEISRGDIARFHQQLGEHTRAEANRCLALLSVMFNLAVDWGNLPETHPNPCHRIKKYKLQSRERFVTEAEMPLLLEAVAKEENPHSRAAIWLLLLTGLRKGELLNLQWKDVDFSRRVIRLEDTKAGRPHEVPLSSAAVEILRELPRFLGNPYVIPSPTAPGKPQYGLTKPWERARARLWLAKHPDRERVLRAQAEADLKARKERKKKASDRAQAVEARLLALAMEAMLPEDRIRIHDLRRTVGSWLAMSGESLPLIGRILNHSQPSTTQIYARFGEDPARAALERHGAALLVAAEGGQ